MTGWRVWCAFDRDRTRDHRPAWRALLESCRPAPGAAVDAAEYDRWVDVMVWYRWADA